MFREEREKHIYVWKASLACFLNNEPSVVPQKDHMINCIWNAKDMLLTNNKGKKEKEKEKANGVGMIMVVAS